MIFNITFLFIKSSVYSKMCDLLFFKVSHFQYLNIRAGFYVLPLISLVTVKYFSIFCNFYVVKNILNIFLLLFFIYHHLKFSLICLWLNKHIFPNTKYLNELVIKLKFSKRVIMIINVRYVLLNFVPNFALYLHYFQN